ncbi:MAG: RpiB/LacA/LacB family sugar-phosphate isomerase [Chlamydiia bacterium]|nr:RpiB/LacA/LacB family sugar-phosphate isomerase [Chlamydiia bacterium]
MKIAVSSDAYHPLIPQLLEWMARNGHQVTYFGPQEGESDQDWTRVTQQAIQEVHKGSAEEAIVLCWTGTGCTILANKFPGIRAALCLDGETAKGARIYNHANVLGLSLRLTTSESLEEVLIQWFETPFSTDAWNLSQVNSLSQLEKTISSASKNE